LRRCEPAEPQKNPLGRCCYEPRFAQQAIAFARQPCYHTSEFGIGPIFLGNIMSVKRLLTAAALAAALSPAVMAETVGSVASVSGAAGSVVGMRSNAAFNIAPGVKLQSGDQIFVGSGASVKLVAADGCETTLASLQSLVVSQDLCAVSPTAVAASSATQVGGFTFLGLTGPAAVGAVVVAAVATVAIVDQVVNDDPASP
jgi:hypothetical protein